MGFKYAVYLDKARGQPCPCRTKFVAKATKAFRWMNNVCSDQDFVPVAFGGDDGDDPTALARKSCNSFSLSFFITTDHAMRRWRDLAARIGSRGPVEPGSQSQENGLLAAAKRYGDHVGEIDLVPDDGLLGPVNKDGHFELHEEEGASFVARVQGYSPILPVASPADKAISS